MRRLLWAFRDMRAAARLHLNPFARRREVRWLADAKAQWEAGPQPAEPAVRADARPAEADRPLYFSRLAPAAGTVEIVRQRF